MCTRRTTTGTFTGTPSMHITTTTPLQRSLPIIGREQPKGPTAKSSDGQPHQPHDCALLSLVSTLKLLDAGGCSSLVVLDSICTPTYQAGLLFVPDVVLNSPARGPPCGYFA